MTVVLDNLNTFLTWGIVLSTILLIYFIIKFIIGPAGQEEAGGGEGLAKIKDFFKKQKEESEQKKEGLKKQQEIKKKKNLVSPVKEHLVRSQEACDEALHLIGLAKTEEDRDKLLDVFKEFNKEMAETWKDLRSLRRKTEKEERAYLTERLAEAEAIKEYISNVKEKIPKMNPAWLSQVQSKGIVNQIKKVRGMVNDLWNKLEKFHS